MSQLPEPTYKFPVPETPFNERAYAVGNLTLVQERGGDTYTGRIVFLDKGKPLGVMLVGVVREQQKNDG